jgi:hypothetical protein
MLATKVKEISGWTGDAALYRLDEPHEGADHVIVSATVAMLSGPETYIFPASAEGEVTDWGELEGSFRGGLDHAEALRRAGYQLTTEETP